MRKGHRKMAFFVPMILETERLILREILPSDAEDMFKLHSHPEVQRYTGEPPMTSIEELKQKMEGRRAEYQKLGYGRWATILKEGNHFTGWAGLLYLPEFDEVDIGYRLLPEYWGQGIATEASKAILDYGFNALGMNRIIAIAMNENEASINVMRKLGMKFEKYAPYEEGSKDVTWYAMEKEDYVATSQSHSPSR